MSPTRLLATLFASCAIAATATADSVTLSDGSKVLGDITQITQGSIIIESASLGTLEIDRASVASFTTDEPRNIELASGERVLGRVIQRGDAQIIESQAVAPMNVQTTDIAAAWKSDEDTPEQRKLQEEQERRKWTGSLFFGLSGQTGTTEKLSFNGRLNLNQDLGDQRTNIYAQTRFSEENGSTSINENIGGIRMEFDLDRSWFLWGKAEVENDEQEDLDVRASFTAGVGYFFIREPETEFKVRAGAGVLHETFGTGDNANESLFEAGYDYKNILFDDIAFTHSMTYLPVLSDVTDDYRINFDTAAEWAMGKSGGWKLRIGMQNKYANAPVDDVERLDTWYYLNLGYAW